MEEMFLSLLKKEFNVTKIDVKEYANVKVGPMKFTISQYKIEGIGNLSFMKGKALMGLMKMDTVMLTSFFKDVPLFSYDRIHALNNDTFIIELYNTCLNLPSLDNLNKINEKYNDIPSHNLGNHWYDSIKLKESISKKTKSKNSQKLDVLLKQYFEELINIIKASSSCNEEEKKEKNIEYVNGLLNNGGPSTDQFIKALGKEKTDYIFKHILFGIN